MTSIQLRDYQQRAVDDIRAAYARGRRAPCLVLPTGGGKSSVASYIAGSAANKGNKALILVHRKELLLQFSATLDRFGVKHGLIASGYAWMPYPVQVASVQTLVKRLDRIQWAPDLITVDECFPAGTLIDGKPIESLKVGDRVQSLNHRTGAIELKPIARLFKSRPTHLCTVHFSDGGKITCTAGHPFFVPFVGYVNALSLEVGVPTVAMQHLRNIGRDCDAAPEGAVPQRNRGVLLSRVQQDLLRSGLIGNYGENQPQICIGSHETQKSDVQSRDQRQNAGNHPRYGAQAEESRREWQGIDQAAKNDDGAAVTLLERRNGRVYLSNSCPEREWLSNSLQAGLGHPVCNGGDRDRWAQSLCTEPSSTRPEEDKVLGISWVDRVEVHQPSSDGRFEKLLPDGFVYNIEVEENHNYFANGVLVHNCHHAPVGAWRKILEYWPKARSLGVTATPCRTDGTGLGEVFDELVLGPSVAELTERGYLSPTRIYAPPIKADLTGVRMRMGDYAKDQLSQAMDKPSITGDAVEHYRKICPGAPAIAFCTSIEHAQNVAEAFRSAGFSSESLDGTVDPATRERLISDLGNGRLNVLTSCEIISEGTDIPVVVAAILLRPTQSLSLALQQMGRVLRPALGKQAAIILDHVGNVATHGLPEMDREWSLEGQQKRSKKKSEPVPVRTCPECFCAHKPQPVCPNCGHRYAVQAREIEQVSGELVEIDKAALIRQRKAEQAQAKTLEELIELGRKKGYKPGWARNVWAARQSKQQQLGARHG